MTTPGGVLPLLLTFAFVSSKGAVLLRYGLGAVAGGL
jgi:hypothetical protein